MQAYLKKWKAVEGSELHRAVMEAVRAEESVGKREDELRAAYAQLDDARQNQEKPDPSKGAVAYATALAMVPAYEMLVSTTKNALDLEKMSLSSKAMVVRRYDEQLTAASELVKECRDADAASRAAALADWERLRALYLAPK
ncbi:MAG: hypothetical protein KDE46_07080 [Caldilineaceae bacterium]|nr:hypothetical protein [Caldilineaceae bacterium]